MILAEKDVKLLKAYLGFQEFYGIRVKANSVLKNGKDGDYPIDNEIIKGVRTCAKILHSKIAAQVVEIEAGIKIIEQHKKNLDRLQGIFL